MSHHQITSPQPTVWRTSARPPPPQPQITDYVKFVEEIVRLEHASFPNKPIYLVGDSFGGCLALAVAARNPTINLVVILANPAATFVPSPGGYAQ
ncbi:unnamed protein product [Camellia sinensis]